MTFFVAMICLVFIVLAMFLFAWAYQEADSFCAVGDVLAGLAFFAMAFLIIVLATP